MDDLKTRTPYVLEGTDEVSTLQVENFRLKRELYEVQRQLEGARKTIAQQQAANYIATRAPEGKIIPVLKNGLITPTHIYTEREVEDILATSILEERHTLAARGRGIQEKNEPMRTALADFQAVLTSIWWVAQVSDGQRLKKALTELGPELTKVEQALTEAANGLPEFQKQAPETEWMGNTIREALTEFRQGIRQALMGDSGQYLRGLASPKYSDLGERLHNTIKRRSPGSGQTWAADEAIRRGGKDYARLFADILTELSAKPKETLTAEEADALTKMQKVSFVNRGKHLTQWVGRRKKQLGQQIMRDVKK